ncbi:acyl-CoA oxidase [Aureococcus anophagefferens]|nr:acyl-CoA oxidase [Aureococcus anophagefferens]
MQDHPEKFFLAHRLLTTVGLSGFGIRFTVQFNLFAGSILGLGGPEQVALLDDMQARRARLLLLTEKQAGVLSGLVVETTATFDESTSEFVLATPNEAAHKNWISQGYTAEHGVVVARLLIKGEDKGPHAFLMRLRDAASGEPMPGVSVVDMGLKTVANDLDNAAFGFDGVRLPRTALLNKFCDVDDDGAYVQTTDERMRIEVIGQRLMTGRMAIAEAALVFAKGLHAKTRAYADAKVCNGLAGEVMLSDMPQLKAVLDESDRELDAVVAYCVAVEAELSHCLRTGAIPSDLLVEKIAVAKIKAIDVSVDRVHKLRLEVGSYALMSNTGFELADMLLCCKFAEGDTRILMQKIARDRLKKLQKDGLAGLAAGAAAWNEQWAAVYELADLVCARHLASAAPPPGFDAPGFQEPLVDRYQDRSDRGQL